MIDHSIDRDPARPDVGHGHFRVDEKRWDSTFFGRQIGSLSWTELPADRKAGRTELGRIAELSDAAGYSLVECHVGMTDFTLISLLEDIGFRVVDSRVRFLTRWTLADVPVTTPLDGAIRWAVPSDRDRIVELTHEGFTDNDKFCSRFKNPDYFSAGDTRRYFEAWIDSTAFEADAASAVLEIDNEVRGYFIYQVRGEYEELPVVKGILTAVAPNSRGANGHLAMQAFLYHRLGLSDWFLDNTTQLTNTPVIRNHIRSSKRLDEIVLTLYRRPAA
ncbi:hypothetical protein [Ilumatobacter sp.]|uniref:hypothetical protein n=1 Tax=Ilumatobacter sp. TaxID=1967498 RepID=UPI003C5C4A36